MKKILKNFYYLTFLIILLFTSNLFSATSTSTYYLSSGIGLSWNFNSTILFNLKLSFGKMVNEEEYYNITIGGKYFINKEAKSWETKYYYFEPQVGSFFQKYPLSGGTGLGLAFFPKTKLFYPKLSLFGGAGLFLDLDYIFKKGMTDIGIEIVIPYPFDESYRKIN